MYRLDFPDLILHCMSTMRMGQSDADSVLDADAEARAVKQLFVADNSALANSLGGASAIPAASISHRLATSCGCCGGRS